MASVWICFYSDLTWRLFAGAPAGGLLRKKTFGGRIRLNVSEQEKKQEAQELEYVGKRHQTGLFVAVRLHGRSEGGQPRRSAAPLPCPAVVPGEGNRRCLSQGTVSHRCRIGKRKDRMRTGLLVAARLHGGKTGTPYAAARPPLRAPAAAPVRTAIFRRRRKSKEKRNFP